MSDQKELIIEPCPFCGEEPRRCQGDKYVQCETTDCAMSHSLTLLAEWNNRKVAANNAGATALFSEFLSWLEKNDTYNKLKALEGANDPSDLAAILAIQSMFWGKSKQYAALPTVTEMVFRIIKLESENRLLNDQINPPF